MVLICNISETRFHSRPNIYHDTEVQCWWYSRWSGKASLASFKPRDSKLSPDIIMIHKHQGQHKSSLTLKPVCFSCTFSRYFKASIASPSVGTSYDGMMDIACVSQTVNSKHEAHTNRWRGEKALLINIMLSAKVSPHCSVVRRPNPALSSLEEIEAFVFFYPAGFLGLMSLPFACLELSLSLAVTHLWHAGLEWCKHTHTHICGLQQPYEVTASTDKVMVTVESSSEK